VTAATSGVRQTHHFKVLVGSTSLYGFSVSASDKLLNLFHQQLN